MAQATCRECSKPTALSKRGKALMYCSKSCANKRFVAAYRKRRGATEGRDRRAQYFDQKCEVCGSAFRSSRPTGRFCSDACKGRNYSLTMRTKSKLPADHPVMVLITEARKPKPKAEKPDPRTPRECPTCAGWFSPLHRSAGHMAYCTDRCAKRASRLRRRAREHNTSNDWRWSDFMRMARKFDYCCAYCGVKPDRLDPDHVIPLSRGGADAITNLLPTCMMCNSSKCAMTLTEWSAWLAERGQPTRRTTWLPGDSRYVHLTDAALDISRAA